MHGPELTPAYRSQILRDAVSRLTTLETEFFRTLNLLVEPAVRAGCGSPGIAPTGLIVLETKGRHTGIPYRTPVLPRGAGRGLRPAVACIAYYS